MNVTALLVPVSRPSALPLIGVSPFGNGLLIDVMGISVSCCSVVVCE